MGIGAAIYAKIVRESLRILDAARSNIPQIMINLLRPTIVDRTT